MQPRQTMLLGAEIALAALSTIAIISLERLFIDTGFLADLLILVLGSHIVAAVCRRAELSMAWATPISGIALVILGTAVFYPDASALIVPTRETVSMLGDDLREAWQVFSDDAAPVPPLRGFLVTTSVLVWYGVFLADWAAFRLRSPLEAVAPATAIFVFGSLLGVDRHEITHGLIFAAGVMAVLLTMRAERQVREEVWVAAGARDGARTTLRYGAIGGTAALLIGAFIAPQVPGASADPLVDITEINNGPQTRRVVSPLVEISASLVDQSDIELFSVRVDPAQRDYWRLMALTKFENEIWRRSSDFDEVRSEVERNVDVSVPTQSVLQEVTIAALGNIYLPAAYEVSNIVDDDGIDLEYEVATGALVIERGLEHIPRGMNYTIESQIPDYAPEDLPAVAAEGMDDGFVREHTELPRDCAADESTLDSGCWPTNVTTLAEQIVADAGATTDHERVLALQSFFLDPTLFTYDLDVDLEHDIESMNTFLTVRRGYCEQFASTFAAMARSLGIPARVAVGFTWGDWSETRGEFIVRGKHAHAWPEVFFAGVGWIVFDPTPGRSRPYDADITGLAEAEQFGANEGDNAEPGVTPPSYETVPVPGTTPNQGTRPTRTTTIPPVAGVGAGSGPSDGFPWKLAAGAGVLVALVGFVPLVQAFRRRRWIAAVAADPLGRGELAWDDAVGALRLLGLRPKPFETPHEFAASVARRSRDLGPLGDLADHITWLRYADGDADPAAMLAAALGAREAAATIVQVCHTHAGRSTVFLNAFDPRMFRLPPPRPVFGR